MPSAANEIRLAAPRFILLQLVVGLETRRDTRAINYQRGSDLLFSLNPAYSGSGPYEGNHYKLLSR